METGQVLKNIVAAKDGTVTLARLDGFISELKAVLAIEDVADPMKVLTNFAEAKMGKNLATMFPTIAKRIELGEEVGWWAENLNKFHGVAQSTAMRPLNTFFASIYMGLSPGYAFRNMMSNGIHILVDQGVGAFIGRSKIGKPGWITPKAGLDNIEGWLGGLYTRGIRGFSQAPEYRLAEGTIGRKLFQPFLRLSEHFEKNGAIRVINKTVEDAMRSMLRPGRALPDIAPLRAAGMSDDAASALLDFVVARKGNIKAAMGDWSNAVASGSVDAGKTFIWADAEDLRKLDSILPGGGITDRLRLALQDAETLEDALKSVDGIWTEIRETAGLVATEVPMQGLTDAERWVGGGTSDAAIAARDEGFMLEETSNTISYQIKANSDSFDASQDAVMSTYESLRHELAGMGMLEKTVDGVKIDIVEEAMKPFEPITTRSLLARFTAEDQEALEVVWGLSNKWGKADDGTDWAKEWVAAGLTGVPPTNLNKRLLKNWLWDGDFRVKRSMYWASSRDAYYTQSQDAIKALSNLAEEFGITLNPAKAEAMEIARWKATLFDNARTLRDNMNYPFSPGQAPVFDAVVRAASAYGIGMTTEPGLFIDQLLSSINKNGALWADDTGREFIALTSLRDEALDYDVVKEIFAFRNDGVALDLNYIDEVMRQRLSDVAVGGQGAVRYDTLEDLVQGLPKSVAQRMLDALEGEAKLTPNSVATLPMSPADLPALPGAVASYQPVLRVGSRVTNLEFANDLDKALYVVGGSRRLSEDGEFLSYLQKLLPDKKV
ncbi:MAG: hypothetical protein JRC86_10685, partial [Deltaproteobacteria bacterium]|nr:hypothetical protein [Deltaproteobacteria bacterium]